MGSLTACAPDPPDAVVGVVATGCGATPVQGSGAVVDPGIVLTSAHVVAGADVIEVAGGATRHTARVVAFDPDLDLAYLAVGDWSGSSVAASPTPLPIAERRAEPGPATVWVIRDGERTAVPVDVGRTIRIHTEDVYVEGATERPGLELDGDIRPGDSGGPVVAGGEVVGVTWARSRRDLARAYAIDAVVGRDRIDRQLASGDLGGDVDLARCP